jgi:low temperature requirement protein LtrA
VRRAASDLDYNRSLESPRFGHTVMMIGIGMLAAGLAMTVADALLSDWAAVAICPVMLACGLFLLFRVGPRAVRHAREHHEFMEEHRRRMQAGGWTP